MTTIAKRMSLAVAMLCLLAALAGPGLAVAQNNDGPAGAEEYDLDLPGSGANEDTPASSGDTSGSDDSGFPVIVVVLVAGAAVAAGFAAWRMRKPHEPDEPSGPPQS
jgi:hypothetical protein